MITTSRMPFLARFGLGIVAWCIITVVYVIARYIALIALVLLNRDMGGVLGTWVVPFWVHGLAGLIGVYAGAASLSYLFNWYPARVMAVIFIVFWVLWFSFALLPVPGQIYDFKLATEIFEVIIACVTAWFIFWHRRGQI